MMDTEILRLLESGTATLAVKKKGALAFQHFGRGIGPALMLLEEQPELLRGAEVYDTIIGKAAASLFILGGAAYVYGQTMSQSAAELLTRYGVPHDCRDCPSQIINRAGTGLCPFEQAVLEVETPEACLPVIRTTLAALRQHTKQG